MKRSSILVKLVLCRLVPALVMTCSWSGVSPAEAHNLGESYVFLRAEKDHLGGHVLIHMTDLDKALKVDSDGDGILTDKEIAAKHGSIADFVAKGLTFTVGGEEYTVTVTRHDKYSVTLGQFAEVYFKTRRFAKLPDRLTVHYNLFFDAYPEHRCRLVIEYNHITGLTDAGETVRAAFDGGRRSQTLDLTLTSPWQQLPELIKEGVLHIWIGYDHILFLLALVLPAVLIRVDKAWQPVESFRPALIQVVKIVTLFTIAHSMTLALAALDYASLNIRVVESIIAASVAAAAINNIVPIFHRWDWLIIFLFGLFHGFGFASVFGDLAIGYGAMLPAVLGFNVGVELGQLAIILVAFPLLYALRSTAFYRRAILQLGSAIILVIALMWFAERAFNLGG